MKDQWDNPNFVIQWDQTSLEGNPTRAEQLDILISLLEDTYREGTTILDLGIGSGLIEALLFTRRPHTDVVGVDSSSAMLDLAKQRLAVFEQHCTLIHHDFSEIERLVLPSRIYQIVISVQSLHHLPHQQQRAVFQFVSDLLPPNGIFLLLDRIAIDADRLSDLYRAAWNRLERVSETKSGWSGDDFLERLQFKEDYPASIEEQLAWLREAGFSATCLHLHLNRALIAGVKKGEDRQQAKE